ncbi:DNA-directed RNA polymerase I subunit RPA43 [Vanessa tameamea]|uniref:DNA-directed RNA polymerase I subunit RPA43 n=1 Tax=Vanessa tameamea TaxID=334116 RepID=A0A8B8HUN8_VANTA|nr:DNA-directed RNA polymerase I subunit RPA43 [Vanessa tameamea]XP_047529503.1 DNA-directed RNA polymerase I subunit RPA43 [Vanessa atalanta]
MSTIIKFDLKELRKLASDKNSCIIEKKVTQNLALQPWCLGNLTDSIKNLLDYKIGKFDKEFDGILLSYKNLRVLQNVGAIHNDNADIHFQVQADYFIFRPYVGATLKGIVNKKSTTHLGILIHRVFNVVIPRPTEEPGYNWIGNNINEGQEVLFQIVVLDLYGALPYIRGKLDERWIKVGLDGEDEAIEAKSANSINVSYINFDKTKPNQKQDVDKKPTSSSKKKSRTSNITKDCNEQVNDEILNHISEKNKSKRHKAHDMEVKQSITKKIKKIG